MTVAARKLTYREFQKMEFDDNDPYLYELLNGVLVRKSAPHINHQRLLGKLVRQFQDYILPMQLGEVFFAPVDVVFSEENAPQSDLLYISKENASVVDEEEGVVVGVPDLLLEIISPSSVKRDRIEKKVMYEHFGVPEYWLVDPNNQSIEVYTLQNGKYELHAFADATEKAQSKIIMGLEIDATTLF